MAYPAGWGRKETRESLDRFFGTAAAATEALECLDSHSPSREARLFNIYVSALHEHSGAKFVLPFRFRATERNQSLPDSPCSALAGFQDHEGRDEERVV
jgi:hypothetical protein